MTKSFTITKNVDNGVRKAASLNTVADFAGTYEMSAETLLDGQAWPAEWVVEVVDETTGELSMTAQVGYYNEPMVIKAFVNVAQGAFAIPNMQNLGADIYGDINYFYIKDVTEDYDIADGASEKEYCTGVVEGAAIVFPELDIWAIGDPNDEDLGWWMLTYLNQFEILSDVDPNEGWSDFCTGTFEDGWGIAGFAEDPADYPWTVNIQRNDENPDLYRLDSPYISEDFPFGEYMDNKAGYIVFDVADPEFVKVLPDYFSGMMNGSQKLYFFNLEGIFSAMGYDKETIISALEGQGITAFSTFENGVVDVPNCRFDLKKPCGNAYVWQGQTGEDLSYLMQAKIFFDDWENSVNILAAGTAQGVEYYNLQGQRVANPASGQLLIKRTANGTIKTIVR